MSRLAASLLFILSASAADRVAVIAHRGEHLQHPENTLAAYRAAIESGADFIEVDVRTTADGKLVVMHNATVDATTNGKGAVKDLTLAQIRALDSHGEKVPAFSDVLQLARGRVKIYVDSKQLTAADLVAELERYDMQDNVVVYGRLEYLTDVIALRPQIKVMPEAVSAAYLNKAIEQLHPRIVAFDARDFTADLIAAAIQSKAGIYVDRLGAADNPASWQDAVDRGATGIQTDKIAALVAYLRSRGYHD